MALLSKVPGMRVLAPSSTEDLQQMLQDALSLADSGPVVIRYPKGVARSVPNQQLATGTSALQLRQDPSNGMCILAVGKMVRAAEEAAKVLDERGIPTTVWDVRSCSPLDPAMLESANRHRAVLTIEDGIRDGGIGMSIADVLTVPTRVLGIPTKFIPQAKPDAILAKLGLDASGVVQAVCEMIGA